MKYSIAAIAILCCGVSCKGVTESTAPVQLEYLWSITEGFQSPESVIYDQQRDVLYVSNVYGYQKNGLGFISKVSTEGEILERNWLTGLNGPTGMAIWDDKLYVADIDELLAIDLQTQQITSRYPSPDQNPGLNDVTVDQSGHIFVSGSMSRTIYQMQERQLQAWLSSDQLRDANGLYADSTSILFVGYYLREIAYSGGAIQPLGNADTLVDLESVESDGQGGYFITAIGARPIHHLSAAGELTVVLERDTFSADIEYIKSKDMLLVPSGDSRLFAFSVESKRR